MTQLAGCIRTAILCHVLNNTLGILAPGATAGVLPTGGAWATALLLALAGASLLGNENQRRGDKQRSEGRGPRGEPVRFSGGGESPT